MAVRKNGEHIALHCIAGHGELRSLLIEISPKQILLTPIVITFHSNHSLFFGIRPWDGF